MIAQAPTPIQPREPWRAELRGCIRDARELLALLGVAPEAAGVSAAAARSFPMRVPRGYAARMRAGDPHDPLLLQVLPRAEEAAVGPEDALDPVGDGAAALAPGLLAKYAGRALMVTTGACAVHCRYCFRRHYPYAEQSIGAPQWRAVIERLRTLPGCEEVILSGGDPLMLADDRLAAMTRELAGLGTLRRLRIHSRLPIVLPSRVTGALLAGLSGTGLQPVMVVHANHPNEIDAPTGAALRRMRDARITVLNQAVLLRGVNDDPATLAGLSEVLFEAGVLPYYLHALDRVAGAAHFAVDDDRARAIEAELRARLPGYLVPRLVREVAGAPAKVPL